MANVAFDVDGTLIDEADDAPRDDIIRLLKAHYERGDNVYVWSGGGVGYASDWVRRLGLAAYVAGCIPKRVTPGIDITYDDQRVKLGKVNHCVGPGLYEERW